MRTLPYTGTLRRALEELVGAILELQEPQHEEDVSNVDKVDHTGDVPSHHIDEHLL